MTAWRIHLSTATLNAIFITFWLTQYSVLLWKGDKLPKWYCSWDVYPWVSLWLIFSLCSLRNTTGAWFYKSSTVILSTKSLLCGHFGLAVASENLTLNWNIAAFILDRIQVNSLHRVRFFFQWFSILCPSLKLTGIWRMISVGSSQQRWNLYSRAHVCHNEVISELLWGSSTTLKAFCPLNLCCRSSWKLGMQTSP